STRTAAVRASVSANGSGRNNLSKQFLASFSQIELKRLRRTARKPRLLRLLLRQSVRPTRARRHAANTALFSSQPDVQGVLAPQGQLDNIGPYRQNEPNLVEIV